MVNWNQVVFPRLFVAFMSICGVEHRGSANDIFLFPFQVLACFMVDEPFWHPEIDDVQETNFFSVPDQKIIGFDVPMENFLFMHCFYPRDHLRCDPKNGAVFKPVIAELKQLLNAGAHHVKDQHFVLTFDPIIMLVWKSLLSFEIVINFWLVLERRIWGFQAL